jgi:Fe-S-cluster containining protein
MDDTQRKLQILDERVEARVQAIRAKKDWWLCRRGCDYCCRHLARALELSPPEWARVDEAVAALPTAIRHDIEQKISALLLEISQHSTQPHIACPFLDSDSGACHIYDARPIACRTYGFFVARSGNQYCSLIEAELSSRGDDDIVWGNADAISDALERISPELIPFDVHYSSKLISI